MRAVGSESAMARKNPDYTHIVALFDLTEVVLCIRQWWRIGVCYMGLSRNRKISLAANNKSITLNDSISVLRNNVH